MASLTKGSYRISLIPKVSIMPYKPSWKDPFALASLVLLLVITACGPAGTTQPAAPAATLAQESTATPLPPTAPAAATATAAAPTATNTEAPLPTATQIPSMPTPQPSPTADLAGLQKGISGWCLPQDVLVSAADDPLKPPERAQQGKIVNGALEIRNMPFSICVFLYAFEKPAPSGLKLEIYDLNQKTPWWKSDLTPVDGKANLVFTRLRHSYIVDPPLWSVGYEFVVRDSSGAELQRDVVNLHRWTTGLCWQGTLPDPVTLYCPLQQDLHPWDPGYGKKLPTVTPRP